MHFNQSLVGIIIDAKIAATVPAGFLVCFYETHRLVTKMTVLRRFGNLWKNDLYTGGPNNRIVYSNNYKTTE